ncbi:MAG: 3-phenylpropionate-dihydrodiol/cinnamic acid-dihydrodiol dehydrogenase [Chroococcidiopsis sp. SAG 2025]|uniref:oxidoreductase n=1 Tax=Chroococcidiopsis sp. SAG 2025 TaxID=171389 RepID=UPI0029373370|nr:oxidoreductase [Chroococcidiopsis sp. SAG 2025]MDV2990688.1 3-phenylpropionate-dihydrodiol/cinnamic acid-dihydrodiol dehydrogenase [Chroococcidiopsis sp. SAG 2025]
MTSLQNSRVWLITGSSSGFGRAIAQAVLDRGEKVVVTARNPQHVEDIQTKYPDRALAVQLDVTQPVQVQAAVEKAIAKFGRIDVLVNNAGYGTMGALEELSDEATRRQFETNVFGALNMMRGVLPSMRQHRSGYILNLSSVGGFVSFPGAGIYCATKFALEALSEALVKEVESLGIKVIIVEPGAFRTDFNGRSLVLADTQITDYEPVVGGFRQWLQDMDGKQPGDPVKAAEAMIQAVNSDNPPLRLALGADAVGAIETKLESVKAEMEAWKDVAVNTAYEGAAVGAIGG